MLLIVCSLPIAPSHYHCYYHCCRYQVFDEHYKEKYMKSGLIPDGNLQHLISDAATMQIIRWTKGGFGMAAHNYDGDMLTDEVAQVRPTVSSQCSSLVL